MPTFQIQWKISVILSEVKWKGPAGDRDSVNHQKARNSNKRGRKRVYLLQNCKVLDDK